MNTRHPDRHPNIPSFGAEVDLKLRQTLEHSSPVKQSVAEQLEEAKIQRSSALLMESQGALNKLLREINETDRETT